jgi:hypothetical protein
MVPRHPLQQDWKPWEESSTWSRSMSISPNPFDRENWNGNTCGIHSSHHGTIPATSMCHQKVVYAWAHGTYIVHQLCYLQVKQASILRKTDRFDGLFLIWFKNYIFIQFFRDIILFFIRSVFGFFNQAFYFYLQIIIIDKS